MYVASGSSHWVMLFLSNDLLLSIGDEILPSASLQPGEIAGSDSTGLVDTRTNALPPNQVMDTNKIA